MSPNELQRAYRVGGFNRLLYNAEAVWPEGTFRQNDNHSGLLVLRTDGIETRIQLDEAIARQDELANGFRIANSWKYRRPLTIDLVRSVEPKFISDGELTDRVRVTVEAIDTVRVHTPAPPAEMPLMAIGTDRWIRTYAEASQFGAYSDEAVKRYYLIIEELWSDFESQATPQQVRWKEELSHVRNFVSHPLCHKTSLVNFIESLLPNAVVATAPTRTVRFDRTDTTHSNLVGRYEPIAQGLAQSLISSRLAVP